MLFVNWNEGKVQAKVEWCHIASHLGSDIDYVRCRKSSPII